MPLSDPRSFTLHRTYSANVVTYDTLGPFPAPALLAELSIFSSTTGKNTARIAYVLTHSPAADQTAAEAGIPLIDTTDTQLTSVPAWTLSSVGNSAPIHLTIPINRPILQPTGWLLIAVSPTIQNFTSMQLMHTVTLEPLTADLRDAITPTEP